MYRGGGLYFHYDEDGVRLSESGINATMYNIFL